jgi:hypothetical protein
MNRLSTSSNAILVVSWKFSVTPTSTTNNRLNDLTQYHPHSPG